MVHFLLVGGKGKGSRDALYLTVYADSNTFAIMCFPPVFESGECEYSSFPINIFSSSLKNGQKADVKKSP